jgi:hypothetical protein
MQSVSLGYVVVAAAGTPVPMSTVLAALGLSAELRVHALKFSPRYTNSSRVYVGLASQFSANTGVGVLDELQQTTATAGHKEHCCICSDQQVNGVRVADYAVDAAVNGEGFVVRAVIL